VTGERRWAMIPTPPPYRNVLTLYPPIDLRVLVRVLDVLVDENQIQDSDRDWVICQAEESAVQAITLAYHPAPIESLDAAPIPWSRR